MNEKLFVLKLDGWFAMTEFVDQASHPSCKISFNIAITFEPIMKSRYIKDILIRVDILSKFQLSSFGALHVKVF